MEDARRGSPIRKPWVGTFHFTFSLESIESTCATYGILSALLLSMNVASFGAIAVDEWAAFESGVAVQRCDPDAPFSFRASNETLSSCVERLSWTSEYYFIGLNFSAAVALMVCLLLSSWLYIAISMPNASRSRPDEVQAVVARFSGEFLTLNGLFLLSVIISLIGLNQLVQIKSKSPSPACTDEESPSPATAPCTSDMKLLIASCATLAHSTFLESFYNAVHLGRDRTRRYRRHCRMGVMGGEGSK